MFASTATRPVPEHVKLTVEDFELFPEDGRRHELIDGEHCVTPAPSTRHQIVLGSLHFALWSAVQEQGLGQVFLAPYDVVLSATDVVEPDLLFVSRERLDLLTEKNLRGAPDLVVEVVSESSRRMDEVVKRKLYERFGVREYWVVDPVVETVKVYRLGDDRYERAAELSREDADRLTSPLLPGLDLPLEQLFV
jgi:Uma2 family endonuclease